MAEHLATFARRFALARLGTLFMLILLVLMLVAITLATVSAAISMAADACLGLVNRLIHV